MWMSDQSPKLDLKTWKALHNVTSSQASPAGRLRSTWLASGLTNNYGRVRHRASPSALPVNNSDNLTSDTLPPPLCASLTSASLQSCLVSRLQQQLENTGSMIYSLTWKDKATPAGRLYCQRQASVPRTKEIDCSLVLTDWPTPAVAAITNGVKIEHCKDGRTKPNKVGWAAALCGWPTPTTRDHKDGAECLNVPINSLLGRQVWQAAWPTPCANNATGAGTSGREGGHNLQTAVSLTQPIRITAIGQVLTGSDAGMENSGQLNPAHSRWLMGFPPEWDDCAVMAMPSSRKSRRNLSEPLSEPEKTQPQKVRVRIRAGTFEHDGWLALAQKREV